MSGACSCSLILMTSMGEAKVFEMAAAVPLTANSVANCLKSCFSECPSDFVVIYN